MFTKKVCVICTKVFIPEAPAQKTCCYSCKTTLRNRTYKTNSIEQIKTVKNIPKYHPTTHELCTEYGQMLINQSFKCAICGKHRSLFRKDFIIDHNHGTGKIRGLLCSKCNTLLGMAEDNIKILNNSIQYLSLNN